MKKIFIVFFTIINIFQLSPDEIYKNYVQVYGEGPIGRHVLGFEPIYYTDKDAVEFARKEIMEFLSGMVYGYNFLYKVENKSINSEGFFELTPIAQLKKDDKNLSLRQLEESNLSIRIQALYRLNEEQKNYLNAFNLSSLARMSMGESENTWIDKWERRLEIYKDAVKNSILNEAKKRLKSRPLYIKGKLLLIESPQIILISGQWRVKVKANVIIKEVSYREDY